MRKIQLLYFDSYSGEDTFINLLQTEYNLRVINVYDLVRTEYLQNTKRSKKIKEFIDNGIIIPINLIISIIKEQIEIDSQNLLLIKYPRDEKSYKEFLKLVNSQKIEINKIWYLNMSNLKYFEEKKSHILKEEIVKETIIKIKKRQKQNSKIIKLWNINFNIIQINIDYQNIKDINEYFKKKITNA